MASGKKITQLTDGSPLQKNDKIPIARGSVNRFVKGSDFATATDISTLTNLITSAAQNSSNNFWASNPTIASLSSLPTDHIWVGNSVNLPAKVKVSGDVKMTGGATANVQIQPNAVTYNKIQKATTGNCVLGAVNPGDPISEIQISTNMINSNTISLDKLAKSTQANVVLGATAVGQNFAEQKVNNSMLAKVDSMTIKGRKTTGNGEVEDLPASDVLAILGVAPGAGANVPTELSINQTFLDKVHIDSSTQTGTGIDILSATNLRAGVMTPADRLKLDGIASGATSSGGTVTSVEGVSPVIISAGSSGDVFKTPKISISLADSTTPGLMPTTLFDKLTGIQAGATNYTHPNHTGAIRSTGDGATFYDQVVPSNFGGAGSISGLLSADGLGNVTAASLGNAFLSPTTLNLSGDITSIGLNTAYSKVVPQNKGGAGNVTGILKADGLGTVSQASQNVDYFKPGDQYPGTLRVQGDVIAFDTSDEQLKKNPVIISNSLQKVQSLRGVSFTWDEAKQNTFKGEDVGVIAQDVEKVLPSIVTTRVDGYKAVRYEKIIPLLIEAIKELQTEVKELKSK